MKELLDLLNEYGIKFWSMIVTDEDVRFEIRQEHGPDGWQQLDKHFSLDVFKSKPMMIKAIKAALKEFEAASRGE